MLLQGGVPPPASHMHVPQALPYVALLIVMLFFIYAVIGMQVGQAPCPQPTSPDAPPLGSKRSPEVSLFLPPPWCPVGAQLKDPLSLWPPAWVPLSIGRNAPKLHNELLIIPQ